MKGKMITFKTDDTIDVVELAGPPALATLQREVGGHIEAVPYFDHFYSKIEDDGPEDFDCVVFCNEEGKLDGLPFNHWATVYWYQCLKRQGFTINEISKDALFGDVVVITGDKALLGRL